MCSSAVSLYSWLGAFLAASRHHVYMHLIPDMSMLNPVVKNGAKSVSRSML